MFDFRNRLSKTNILWGRGEGGYKMCEFWDRNFTIKLKKLFPEGVKLFQLANTVLSKISIFWGF